MFKRIVEIKKIIQKNKVLIIYGPRQVGKTTLVMDYLSNYKGEYIYKTGDDIPFSNLISQCSLKILQDNIPEKILLVIDEAHKIENIGRALKLVVDNIKDVGVIVTGSSSFDLMNQTGESLTGRKMVETLYPISILESLQKYKRIDLSSKVKDYMIYGMYPSVLNANTNEERGEIVTEIASSYLLKDILEFDKIKSSKTILDLLKLIAFQIGRQVSTTELASTLGIDKNTVARYLDLLEKSFVIYSLRGFSRNLRKEINKMQKYYFYDLGIRNAIINNFNQFDSRNDIGELWENFLISERVKRNAYKKISVSYYFWRTYDQKEIDLIEEMNGELLAYEFKINSKQASAPKDFTDNYKNSKFKVVSTDNYFEFLT